MTTLQRSTFFNQYSQNLINYLSILYPEYTQEKISSTVNEILHEIKGKALNITFVHHPAPGNSQIRELPIKSLLTLSDNHIVTPSGSIYKTHKEQSSFFVDLIKTNTKQRSIAKKKKLEAKAKGNKLEADYWENQQQQKKYDNNGFSGLLRNSYVGFADVAGYNATTSLARKSIYVSYAHVERFLANNFYLPTFDSIINHCLLIKQYAKPIDSSIPLIDKLYIPTKEDVFNFIAQWYKQYYHPIKIAKIHLDKLKTFLDKFTQDELTYLFYYQNFAQIVQYNNEWLKPFIQQALTIEDTDINDSNIINDITTVDDDLLIVLSVMFSQYLHGDFLIKDGKLSVQDEHIQKLILLTSHKLQGMIEQQLLPLLVFFIDIPLEISDLQLQKRMIRKAVVSSDTDSVLYTKDPYVKWYTGNSIISQDSMNISALLDYLLTKTIKYPLKTHCINHGVDPKDLNLINMKNEYTYTVFIAANKPKTYVGGLLIQEGRVFKSLELDIKGSIYKGSIYPTRTLTEYNTFLSTVIETISKIGKISAKEFIQNLINREESIIKMLQQGDTSYLTPRSVRLASDYKDANKSIFFNCALYNKIFGQKYGVLTPPLKTLTLDIDYKLFKSNSYLTFLQTEYPKISEKFVEAINDIDPKKHITFFIINPAAEQIPKELIPVINYKAIAYKNCKPWYELYQSLGINIPPLTNTILFSDIYC